MISGISSLYWSLGTTPSMFLMLFKRELFLILFRSDLANSQISNDFATISLLPCKNWNSLCIHSKTVCIVKLLSLRVESIFVTSLASFQLELHYKFSFLSTPLDTGRKLNVHKTFRRRPGHLLNVLCPFSLDPVPMG